ncbi:PBP1A family penicillin-binding protein [Psychrobacter sp. I-STPA6b]|uniref:PBP1A family penicillin-binding protein n=1 Tax=Psychrobacter sp. I-STPA6b TaxID=2585718 RepID=UPI001D0C6134|nr:PBP1A family penicillin-binding protein [Psychrobacter sp. I-STPA6b]
MIKKQKSTAVRLIQYLFSILLAGLAFIVILVLAVPIGFYGMAMYVEPSLPSIDDMTAAHFEMPLQIYSQDDKLIGQYGNRMSLPVSYDEVPKNLVNAFLAAEDSTFFEHSGISIKGLGRAVTEVVTSDDEQTGGSTITMQVAKNYFLSPERTLNRKLTELFLARKIEDQLSKQEILTLYVNKIYLGEGAYGIRAAAKKYYSKSLDNLTIAEMAMLAGLPKAPSKYNPVANPERALLRRNWILGQMLRYGYINQQEHDHAVASPIGLNLYQEKLDANMPYLAEMTRYTLVSRYGDNVINSGWRVRLTVNSQIQQQAETSLKRGLINYDQRHGWRGAVANDEPLSNFSAYGSIQPAKVTRVRSRSFEASLASGESITVNWSGMRWAKKYYSANRTGNYPSSASQLVKNNDIVYVIPNQDKSSWQLTQIPAVQGSLVALNPDTGALEALVGGFDFRQSKFNRATQGWRQPGSTIKPLIYAGALEKGYRPDSLVSDSPLQVGNWKPRNSDGRYYGDIPLRKGLYLSRNLVSIRLLNSIGITTARHLLNQFGLDQDKMPTTLSLALGAGQATPLQMATAYSAFANGGHRIQPYFIAQIYDYNNRLVYQANPAQACALCFNKKLDQTNEQLLKQYNAKEAKIAETLDSMVEEQAAQAESIIDTSTENTSNSAIYDATPASDRLRAPAVQYNVANQAPRILSSSVAYEMADILRDVVRRGTATKAKVLNRSDIGGKTGTTNDTKDAWFAGFQPTLVSIVWVGFDQPSTLGRREYGGTAALPIWIDFMRTQLKDRPHQWVSINNQAKSKKQQQEIIDITDNGEVVVQTQSDDSTESQENATENHTPPQATTKQRQAPKPKPAPVHQPEQRRATPSPQQQSRPTEAPAHHSTEANTQPQRSTPLTVTPVDELPPLDN